MVSIYSTIKMMQHGPINIRSLKQFRHFCRSVSSKSQIHCLRSGNTQMSSLLGARHNGRKKKKVFGAKEWIKRRNRTKTKGISDYFHITHDESQIPNRDPVFYCSKECLLEVLFGKDRRKTVESKKYLMYPLFHKVRSVLKTMNNI